MALIMNPGGDFMSYYNSQHPQEPGQALAPEQPSEVDKLLQAVTQSFQEQPESGVAQPPPAPFNPMAGGWRGALNTIAAPYNQYQAPLIAPTLQYQQQQALQYPQMAAADRVRRQEIRQKNLTRALNVASLLEQRKAQIQRLGQPPNQTPQMQPNRGNVRVYPQVDDSNSPTGVSAITTQLVLQPDGSIKEVEIDRKPVSVSMTYKAGVMGSGPAQQFQINPRTGKMEPTGLLIPSPVGAVNAAVSNVEAKQALDQLVGAYNVARKNFGIEYANPSMLAKVRAKISQGLSQHEWLRDLQGAGISAPMFLQFDSARKRALNSYVKAQTGAQFSLKELQRYEAQFPLPWDDPDTAQQLLESLAEAAVGKMNSLISQYGGLQNMMKAHPPEVDTGGASNDFSGFVRP